MQVKVFSVPVTDPASAEAEMNAFLRSHRVLICAAAFRERVLHHAIMNVCEPLLERSAIADSYACRVGKGQWAAVRRAQSLGQRYPWFLKMDVRKYFDSVDHSVLLDLLRGKFKDAGLLRLFERILASYSTRPGCGLPIGNLSSQHFANFYLGPLDRFIKEDLRRPAYVRYMDDFVVWGMDARELREICRQVRAFLAEQLRLELKPGWTLDRCARGMTFLGCRLYPHRCRLSQRSKQRFVRKLRLAEKAWRSGRWTEWALQQRVQCLVAFVSQTDSVSFRRAVLRRFGGEADGLEPRVTRGQLEQRRAELPVGVSQQQRPQQQEQQHRVPRGPGPSFIPPVETGGTDPAALLSCQDGVLQAKTAGPPGASRRDGVSIEHSGRSLPLGSSCQGSAVATVRGGQPLAPTLGHGTRPGPNLVVS